MENNDIELFLHAQGMTPQAVTASPDDTLRVVLLRAAMISDREDGLIVFVGECEEALKEAPDIEDGVDEHEPVDIDLTLDLLEIHRYRQVHCHRCRHIAVEVNFGGMTKRHRFSPATTIAIVTQWARKKFANLDPAAAAEYVLQIGGTATQPRPSEHLGEVVSAGTCSISFDLVKEITPQG